MEEKGKEKGMVFGKRYRVGNFWVLKYTRVLRRDELVELRKGIPMDAGNHVTRNGLPFIKVGSASGVWGVEFCCSTAMYRFIDRCLGDGDTGILLPLFTMWFMDTTVLGDGEYQRAKADLMKSFLERQKSALIDGMRRDEEAWMDKSEEGGGDEC